MSAAAVRRILQRAFDEYYEGLQKVLVGLSSDERRFRIGGDTNHIDFIVWHMARNEDGTVSACSGVDELWREAGWHQRWALAEEADGCAFTTEDVEAFPAIARDELWEYFAAVRTRTQSYLDVLTEDDLDRPMCPSTPAVSIAQVMSHLVVEQSQHLGQIALIRGVQRGLEFATSWNNPDTPTPD